MTTNMTMGKKICVYSSSSDVVDQHYFAAARELGKYMAQNHYTLIFGGGRIGLMGELARAVHEYGGKVIGVIPEYLNLPGIAYEEADRMIITTSLRERKTIMEEQADAFIGLPGGFGTLEEILEILTLKQLHQHSKPVVFINTGNFYQHLIDLFDHILNEKFAKSIYHQLYFFTPDIQTAISYIESYTPPQFPKKWF
jgi:uncharacterized protein (TIGR00730 family)